MIGSKPKIVVIGGGTGTATVLSALATPARFELTAIVTVSDSGGSTGRLRDEFGFIPVGDVRACLAALATGHNSREVKDLLLYRFDRGEGLSGHNLGNLILTALTDLYGTPGKAIEVASKILRINGQVFPVSEQPADLVIHFTDGSQVIGEDYLNYIDRQGRKIARINLARQTPIYPPAAQAIREADLVIIGPGDLYASLLPNTLVAGFREALAARRGKYIYIANLMSCATQTLHLTATDHVAEICRYTGQKPDIVVINNQPITDRHLITRYQAAGLEPIVDDLDDREWTVKRAPLVAPVNAIPVKGDRLPRSFLRHHAGHLRALIEESLDV
ncbi:YvcK family protein [bacterium]|nr:YvcK family protein [bacterium]